MSPHDLRRSRPHDPALAGGLGYDAAVKDYELRVRQTLSKIDVTDAFRLEIDEAATGHMVTWDAIYDTILTELNGSHRSVGTARGGNGRYAVHPPARR